MTTPESLHPNTGAMVAAADLSGQYDLAIRFSKDKKPDEAFALLEQLTRPDAGTPKKLRRHAHEQAMWCLAASNRWIELEAFARLSTHRYPKHAWAYRYLGEAFFRQGRVKKAARTLEMAIEMDPAQTDARVLLEILRRRSTGARRRVHGWPARQRDFANARKVIEQYILRGERRAPFIEAGTVFMTFGSCFATNLGRRLRTAGFQVNSETIGEEVNSTFANRYLLEWIERGPVDGPTSMMDRVYGEAMRQRFLTAIKGSDVVVMTLGVAPCFFDGRSGEFVFYPSRSKTGQEHLSANHVMRTTTVAENVRNLVAILDGLQRIAGKAVKVVLTVSPVPLTGTTEFGSAVIADCISKSTLRVACHEVLLTQQAHDLVYWPSFEIVRWLGAHFGPDHPSVFGAEDGNTRHVSEWIVSLIIDLFLEHNTASPEAAPSQIGA